MIKCYFREKEVPVKFYKYPAGEVGYKIDNRITDIIVWFEGSDDILYAKMLSQHNPHAAIIFPYLPFGREDRRVTAEASFGLELLRELFDAKDVYTFDRHSKVVMGAYNMKPDDFILKVIKAVKPKVLAFPDLGAKDRYAGTWPSEDIIYGRKGRDQYTGEVKSYELNKVPEADKILVIDDICDGGRTFIELAKLLPGKELYLYVSHGIFSKGFDELKQYYKHIYTTDSYLGQRDPEFVTEFKLKFW